MSRHRSSIPRGVDCGGYEEVRRTSLVGTDRLVRALAVEMHENWLEATRYLNMNHLKEHKKEALRAMAA